MLPVVITAADGKSRLGPDDLAADLEAASLNRGLNLACVPARVPDVSDVAGEERIGISPVDAIIVFDGSRALGFAEAGRVTPFGVVVHTIGWVGDHEDRCDALEQALDLVGKRAKDIEASPLDIWKKALENITPQVEVKSRRVGGATFQVPMEIRPDRKASIGIKNLIFFARKRSGRSMSEKLAAEIIAAYNNEGAAFKKKEDTHKMAEANKAFAHFRF